jgi:hypothetical protein
MSVYIHIIRCIEKINNFDDYKNDDDDRITFDLKHRWLTPRHTNTIITVISSS